MFISLGSRAVDNNSYAIANNKLSFNVQYRFYIISSGDFLLIDIENITCNVHLFTIHENGI